MVALREELLVLGAAVDGRAVLGRAVQAADNDDTGACRVLLLFLYLIPSSLRSRPILVLAAGPPAGKIVVDDENLVVGVADGGIDGFGQFGLALGDALHEFDRFGCQLR